MRLKTDHFLRKDTRIEMNEIKNWIHNHKRQTILLVILLVIVICAGVVLAAVLGKPGTDEAPKASPTKLKFSAEDLNGIVTGLEGKTYVLAGSTLDLLSLLSYDDSIVLHVTAGELDLSSAANLEAKYTFTVDAKALCEILGREFPENGAAQSTIVASKEIIVVDPETAQDLEDSGTVVHQGTQSEQPESESQTASSDDASEPDETKTPDANSETATNSENTGNSGNTGNVGNTSHGTSGSGGTSGEASSDAGTGGQTPHVHTWVNVSPENSWHMEYAAECRAHGYNGEEPMFFRSMNDLYLHQAADGCMSGWGTGFKGLAFKYCSGCGEEVITGHVHDFGTVAKEVYFEKVVCECGMSFTAGKDYTALESWNTHVDSYTSHGDPKENHDDYQIVKSSVTRYEATKTCTCGWRPVDKTPVY